MAQIQDPSKIRNIASNHKTPFQGFSSRRIRNEFEFGLLFPPKGKE
jgi:hypothetical protein